jgi:hypothetical protein
MQSPTKATPPRHTRDPRSPRPPLNTALLEMLRPVVLIGGLVIIVDLGTQAIMQRNPGQDALDQLQTANAIANVALFSVLGAIVARQTGRFYLSALAGLLASLLDAAVVLAASIMAPPPGGSVPIDAYLLQNFLFAVVPATISGVVVVVVERTSGTRQR